MNKNRIYMYDNLKYLLIVFVVIGHMFNNFVSISNFSKSIFIFIYSFHMPLFIFVSGIFHKNQNITKKVVSFIVIGFVMKMIFSLENLILFDENPMFSLLSDSNVPWYLFALSSYILISYLLRNVNKRFILISCLLLSIFVGYDTSIGDFLYLSRIIVFYPFYLLGQMINSDKIISFNKNKKIKIISIIILLIWFILCILYIDKIYILRPLFTGKNSYSVNPLFLKYGFIFRILCYIITVIISTAIISLIPNKRINMITEYGKRTLQIYFWHQIIINIVIALSIDKLFYIPKVGRLFWIFLSILISLILENRIFSFPTKHIINYINNNLKEKIQN